MDVSIKQEKYWEDVYNKGEQLNNYPYDQIVSFIFRNYPKDKNRSDINILELGCGAGNNLWFAAREGFKVTGIDWSKSAIEYAKNRFIKEGLTGNFIVGEFDKAKELENKYDLIINREAMAYIPMFKTKEIIQSLKKILKNNGMIYFASYSDRDSACASGEYDENYMTVNMKRGVSGTTETYYYGRRDIFDIFEGYKIISMFHTENVNVLYPEHLTTAEWRVVALNEGEK